MAAVLEGRRPVVPMPRWSNIIGCARAVIAILVLAFTAASTGIWGGFPAFGVALFTSSATLIVFAYYFVSLSRSPGLYNRWVVLALEALGTLLWLVSLALLSRWTSFYHRLGEGYGFWHAPFPPSAIGLQSHPRSNSRKTGIAFAGTAAGLSGLEFVLFALTLTTFGMALHRQRVGEVTRVSVTTVPAATSVPATDVEKEEDTTAAKPKPKPIVV